MWVDDEIDSLKPHILFLEQKGYQVTPVNNGEDALILLEEHVFDLVFLDEHMPGMNGIDTLVQIKEDHPSIPVVMITKSEEESIMEDAIGAKIADYLIKPVNPSQILLTTKRLLEHAKIRNERSSQDYLRNFNQIAQQISGSMEPEDWFAVYKKLTNWQMNLENGDDGLKSILLDQYDQANLEFGKYIEREYKYWLKQHPNNRPKLSPDIVREYVAPLIDMDRPVFLFVIDCMRYDQWLLFQHILSDYFTIENDFYYSILPTATPYSRNAIFAGLFPSQIEEYYPSLWDTDSEDEHSLNKYEDKLLEMQLKKLGYRIKPRYQKVIHSHDGKKALDSVSEALQSPFNAYVFNFVDTLVHSRSDSQILKEIAPDVPAFRSLTRTWFEHSVLLQILRQLAEKDVKIVITTDHGSVRALRDTQVLGDKHTSTSLRYKYGRNVNGDSSTAIIVKKPSEYLLPENRFCSNYLFAKENYYFVYPTNYHKFKNKYKDSFQHGGVSMEEMILPVATLTPKRT